MDGSRGNKASPIYSNMVKRVSSETKVRTTFWKPDELLAIHPLQGKPVVVDSEPAFSNEKLEAELLKISPAEMAKVALDEGDAERGKALFYESAACFVCHDPPAGAARLGPDLAKMETVLSEEELVDSILRPSKTIDKEFVQWHILDLGGRQHTGIRVAESDEKIVLRNAEQPRPITIKKDNIDEMRESKVSSMPANLVRQLKSREEFNDLLRYVLETRR